MKFRVKYLPNKLDANNLDAKQKTVEVEAAGKLEAAMLALSEFPDALIMRVLPLGDTE
jgi:hypothetical protein